MNEGSEKKAPIDTAEFRETVHDLGRDANVRMVYGEPQVLEGRTLIPVAQIHYAGGGGFGSGGGHGGPETTDETGERVPTGAGEGEGFGVGVRVKARPIGMLEVTAEHDRWIPTLDFNRLATVWSIIVGAVFIATVRGALGVARARASRPCEAPLE